MLKVEIIRFWLIILPLLRTTNATCIDKIDDMIVNFMRIFGDDFAQAKELISSILTVYSNLRLSAHVAQCDQNFMDSCSCQGLEI